MNDSCLDASCASKHLHIPDETSDSNHSSVVTVRFSFLQTNLYTTRISSTGLRRWRPTSRACYFSRHPPSGKPWLVWSGRSSGVGNGSVRVGPMNGDPEKRSESGSEAGEHRHRQLANGIKNRRITKAQDRILNRMEKFTKRMPLPVELGVPLTVLEDQHQFILGWHLQWHGGDVDVAVPLVAACQAQYPELRGCSFDRGFHSPTNQQQLAAVLEHVALPAKGRGTEASRARDGKASFVARRRRHPGVESAIHALESHGLDRVRTQGREGFERTVGISILAANLHRLGRLLQQRAARRSHRTHAPPYRLTA